MAKRRAGSRPVRQTPTKTPRSPGARRQPTSPTRTKAVAAPGAESQTRPGHLEAVALYEQGVAAMQAHEFARASSALRAVIAGYPSERDLHDRVRLYLNVCDRHMTPRAASPSTPEERVFAATLAVNTGNLDSALDHLRAASAESPSDDHALYMLATVLAMLGHTDDAIPPLLRAIELNPDNRSMARHDPDLEPLRQYDKVRAALGGPGPARSDRGKSGRRHR